METVSIRTQDGVELAGDLVTPTGNITGTVGLFHMMPADRTSWRAFAQRLAEQGKASCAIDLRGHGASRQQNSRKLNHQTFSNAEHQASRLDVEAALAFLAGRFPNQPRGVVGASIGANLALWALAHHPEIDWAVCLSPGLNYHGLTTPELMGKLRPNQTVYLAASQEDHTAFEAIQELAAQPTVARVSQAKLAGAGHGTTMWERQPSLTTAILDWIMHQQEEGCERKI